ncbi:MAG TPA: DUF3566 domain-containing protein [Candidatus Nanoarchaeia archaeon]|nr:DUF3566 domain-containing protein [Candidatus Nanoarchaeia archaeon]
MAVIKRLDVWSVAKIQALIMAVFGLVFGILYAFFLSGVGLMMGTGMLLGLAPIIALPVLYGILGLALGALTALLYNLFARWVGGIEIELSK